MQFLSRCILLIGLTVLVIAGLNAANQGLNGLTMDRRPPVFACKWQEDSIRMYTLGQVHTIEMEERIEGLEEGLRKSFTATQNYLDRVWRIYRAVLQ